MTAVAAAPAMAGIGSRAPRYLTLKGTTNGRAIEGSR